MVMFVCQVIVVDKMKHNYQIYETKKKMQVSIIIHLFTYNQYSSYEIKLRNDF